MNLQLTAFPSGARGAQGRPVALAWPALAVRLTTHLPTPPLPWACSDRCCRVPWRRPGACPKCKAELVPSKVDLPAWSPWSYRDHRRAEAGALRTCALVIDYDGTISLDEAREPWTSWAHVGHTTWSHADPARAHVRVVLPLQAPVEASLWPRLWAWSVAHDDRQDGKVGDRGRLYFAPFTAPSPAASPAAWCHDGAWLDVAALELPASAEPTPAPRPSGGAPPGGEGGRALYRDRASRAELGARLGGRVGEAKAKGIKCPSCARPSVWWWLDAGDGGAWLGAGCEHRQSCGWTGWLDQVEKAVISG